MAIPMFFLVLFLFQSCISATTITIDEFNGVDKQGCSPCKTLQFALTQISNDGDTIELLTSLNSISGQTNITLSPTDHSIKQFNVQGASNSTIAVVCNDQDLFGWTISTTQSILISGISFTGCQTALVISNCAFPIQIENCSFSSNINDIYIELSVVQISNSYFLDSQNVSLNIFNGPNYQLNVSNSNFIDGMTWALFNFNGDQSIFSNCRFSTNQQVVSSPTYFIFESGSSPTFSNSSFKIYGSGLGFLILFASTPNFLSCSFTRLSGTDGVSLIQTSRSRAKFQNCIFSRGSLQLYSAVSSFDSFIGCTFQNWSVGTAPNLISTSATNNTYDSCLFSGINGLVFGDTSSSSTISNSNFTLNDGSIFNLFLSLTVYENNIFLNNSNAGSGGVGTLTSSNPIFKNCKFVQNQATVNGGAFFITEQSIALFVDCLFYSNTAISSAGAVFSQDSATTFQNVIFDSNMAGSTAGAVYSLRSIGDSFLNCDFGWNNALIGGALRIDSGIQTSFLHCSFASNQADFGPALYLFEAYGVVLSFSNLTDHGSSTAGGGITAMLSTFQILNCLFQNSNAPEGGAISVTSCALFIDSSSFVGCHAYATGAAILMESGSYNISNSRFSNCSVSDGNGGAISINSGLGTITTSVFDQNSCSSNGAAIYFSGGFLVLKIIISQCNFTANVASSGSIAIQNGNARISDCFFDFNQMKKGGGGIYITTSLSATIEPKFELLDSYFSNNVGNDGGALVFDMNIKMYKFKVKNCVFINNTADSGGAISIGTVPSEINFEDCLFLKNSVLFDGGAVDSKAPVGFRNCTFESNFGLGKGGAISISNTNNLILNQTKFLNNTSLFGGAIGTYTNYLQMNQSIFIWNSALNGGGAIYYDGMDIFRTDAFYDCVFQNNFARFGQDVGTSPSQVQVVEFPVNIESSIGFNTTIRLVDQFNNTVVGGIANGFSVTVSLLGNESDISISSPYAGNSIAFDQNTGIATFVSVLLRSRDLVSVEVAFTANLNTMAQVVAYGNAFLVPCSLGYYADEDTCKPCTPYQFTFNGSCVDCPLVSSTSVTTCAQQNTSSGMYTVKSGFWMSQLTNPTDLLVCTTRGCPGYNCFQSNSSDDWDVDCEWEGCLNGFQDRLCSQCAENYFPKSSDCVECSKPSLITAIIIFIVGIILIFFANTYARVLLPVLLIVLIGVGVLVFHTSWWVFSSLFFSLVLYFMKQDETDIAASTKIAIFFTQTFLVVVPRDHSSDDDGSFLEWLSFLNIKVAGVECLIGNDFVKNAVFQISIPFVLFVAFAILAVFANLTQNIRDKISRTIRNAIYQCFDRVLFSKRPALSEEAREYLLTKEESGDEEEEQKEKAKKLKLTFKQELLHLAVILSYMSYFGVSGSIIEVFHCDDGFVSSSPWIPCDLNQSEYFTVFIIAIVASVVFVVGAPLLYAIMLKYFRFHNAGKENQQPYPWTSFLADSYEDKFYWYEISWMVRKLVLSAAITLMDFGDPRQAIIIQIVFLSPIAFNYIARPFKRPVDATLEAAALLSLSIAFAAKVSLEYSKEGRQFVIIATWVVFGFVSLFLLYQIVAVDFWTKLRSSKLRKKIELWWKERREGIDLPTQESFEQEEQETTVTTTKLTKTNTKNIQQKEEEDYDDL